ncbi:MAG TPA: branched-chain amino acid ABC transporter permease [Burkholderiales bacterium]|nr:branched-chain amino acid ABC transporter permease [Burkholderiales bacterium]
MRYLGTAATLLVDGIAFSMVLFLISIGMTVTLGIMRVVNLAHCAFAMAGGYLALALVQHASLGLMAALPIAVIGTMILGAVLEKTVYRWVYATSELGQILMTIGLTFLMIAAANLLFGSTLQTLPVPKPLAGTWEAGDVILSTYRGFLVLVAGAIAATLWAVMEYTDVGARLRAAVDNPRIARAVGINVPRVFAATFALGCGLAAIGGVLGTQMLPLEPWYALKYLVLVLMVVAVGGLGSIQGSFYAALLLGLIDTFGRYLVPALGAFLIYLAVVALLLWRPQGLFGRS